MQLNWLAFNYRPWDGYGRYSGYMVRALRRAGVDVTPHFAGAANAAAWLLQEWGMAWDRPTISCLPPYYLQRLPAGSAPHWLLTMTEGSECPEGWAAMINESGVARVIVPCEHNAEAFRRGGVTAPVSVVHGGTDPDEFALLPASRDHAQPYTFLTLADRGKRKGWMEAYTAFFAAFGTVHETGADKVRLVIKCRPGGNDLVDMIADRAKDIDPRIVLLRDDFGNIADYYAMGDCLVLPSRSEGWGMPHREGAMMGLPVITQAHSGMDDGNTHEWAIVVEAGQMQPIDATRDGHIAGQWRVVDTHELAATMRACYDQPKSAASLGRQSASWLRQHQTWDHSATKLLQILQQEGALAPEMEFA